MKKCLCALLAAVCCTMFGGCMNRADVAETGTSARETETGGTMAPQYSMDTSVPSASATVETFPTQTTEKPLEPVFPLELVFSSGAGAWRTFLTLNGDGTFEGTYSDSDMGDSGEEYPRGTIYYCFFSGRFEAMKREDAHAFSMVLAEVTSKDRAGEERIENGIRHVASTPYGLEGGNTFFLYLPDTPVNGLPEDFLSWWPAGKGPEKDRPETLSCYGLYNRKMGYAFFTNPHDN